MYKFYDCTRDKLVSLRAIGFHTYSKAISITVSLASWLGRVARTSSGPPSKTNLGNICFAATEMLRCNLNGQTSNRNDTSWLLERAQFVSVRDRMDSERSVGRKGTTMEPICIGRAFGA